MAKPEDGTFWKELLAVNIYKRNQGRLSRQLTAAGLALLVFVGAWTMSRSWLASASSSQWVVIGIPVLLSAVGAWVIYRLVNFPKFAEFLISVEGEMNKVSWASRQELYRATVVVLTTMIFLGVILAIYDFVWSKVLSFVGVLQL